MGDSIEKADCILAMGSHDTRVASRAAELYLEGWAPLLVYSGGLGRLTRELWDEPEATKFARIAIGMGVPPESMLTETRSTNTGENVSSPASCSRAEGRCRPGSSSSTSRTWSAEPTRPS